LRFSTAGKHLGFIRNRHTYKKQHISNIFKSNQGFMATVVYRALPSLHGGSIEITLSVPFRKAKKRLNKNINI